MTQCQEIQLPSKLKKRKKEKEKNRDGIGIFLVNPSNLGHDSNC